MVDARHLQFRAVDGEAHIESRCPEQVVVGRVRQQAPMQYLIVRKRIERLEPNLHMRLCRDLAFRIRQGRWSKIEWTTLIEEGSRPVRGFALQLGYRGGHVGDVRGRGCIRHWTLPIYRF